MERLPLHDNALSGIAIELHGQSTWSTWYRVCPIRALLFPRDVVIAPYLPHRRPCAKSDDRLITGQRAITAQKRPFVGRFNANRLGAFDITRPTSPHLVSTDRISYELGAALWSVAATANRVALLGWDEMRRDETSDVNDMTF